jgi:hypothetical protein
MNDAPGVISHGTRGRASADTPAWDTTAGHARDTRAGHIGTREPGRPWDTQRVYKTRVSPRRARGQA